ncbi:TrbI/VirB10 family protein [Legionella spiritensis]|uniref:TrbI/VirB10 family protein n=1 Tax=Legionella spiritensis TaxID=452 RepID=UPI000F6C8ED4|nr:TrbI/VirB10 family protein [Legionella spiritensis]VEG91193.1 protein LvhB10 [Legionella spiritensis]
MNANETNTQEQDESVASLSKVTPPVRRKGLLRGYQAYVGFGIGALLLLFGFLPSHSESQELAEESGSPQKEFTLSQNMALIERMKQEAQQTHVKKAVIVQRPPKLRPRKKMSKETLARMNAPTTFFNAATTNNVNITGEEQSGAVLNGNNANAQFINQQNDITSVTAKRLPHPALTVPAGEMIPATLETAIHSELPGMVRAITTRDVYSLQGENLLIPRGSTLVGQFNSAVSEGQSRILVVWNRVQLANGVIATLNSPGTDSIGRSGQGADYINRHFFERFGTSALLSILGAYTANNGVNGQDEYNSKSQYRMAIASSFQQAAGQTLQHSMQIKPTLAINQGTPIHVFVAHDLDFHGVITSWK